MVTAVEINVGRELGKFRRTYPGACVVCGTPWDHGWARKRYCNPRCSQRAKYARMKARKAAENGSE